VRSWWRLDPPALRCRRRRRTGWINSSPTPHGRCRWNSRPAMVDTTPMRWGSCRHRRVKAANTRTQPWTDRRGGPQATVSPHRRNALQIAATGPSPNEPSNVIAQTTTDAEPTTSLIADPDRLRSNHSSTRTTQPNTITMKTRYLDTSGRRALRVPMRERVSRSSSCRAKRSMRVNIMSELCSKHAPSCRAQPS